MIDPSVRVLPNLEGAANALAATVATSIHEAAERRGRVTLVFSGGSTPRPLHRALASDYEDLPWTATHVFLGDERHVPRDSPHSNYAMLSETLLDHVRIAPENVHPWATDLPRPEDTADAMELLLKEFFEGRLPRFDVIILGIGDDGHTASLFPNSPALNVPDRLAVAARAPDEPRERMTLTLPVINNARAVHFLVAGAAKRHALQCAFGSPKGMQSCPASLVNPTDGSLTWWLDEEAAAILPDVAGQ